MKRLVLPVVMTLMMSSPFITSAHTVVTYTYDEAGNRITRTTTTETEAAEPADNSDTDKEGGEHENS